MVWFDKNKNEAALPEEEPKEQVKTVDTYNVYVGCDNCQYISQLAIPKKITVDKVVDKQECENCGIKSVKKISAQELKELSSK